MAAGRRQPTLVCPGLLLFLSLALPLWIHSATEATSAHALDCDFDRPCSAWTWDRKAFRLYNDTSDQGTGQLAPAEGGQYLLAVPDPQTSTREYPVRAVLQSDLLETRRKDCAVIFQSASKNSSLTISLNITNGNHVEVGNLKQDRGWEETRRILGVSQPFHLIFEFLLNGRDSYLALDSIRVTGCSEEDNEGACNTSDPDAGGRGLLCPSTRVCLLPHQICDFHKDCLPGGEDEQASCENVTWSASCNFESGLCGWTNGGRNQGDPSFVLNQGMDHTYGNATGHYMQSKFPSQSQFGHDAVLTSAQFTAPPYYHRNVHSVYYKSCQVRFWYAMEGTNTVSDFHLSCVQEAPIELECDNKNLLWVNEEKATSQNRERVWKKAVVTVPPLHHSYKLRFRVRRGYKHSVYVLIDDITLSPECFGIGVPANELTTVPPALTTYVPPTVSKRYSFTSCDEKGSRGPSIQRCRSYYAGKPHSTQLISISDQRAGVQLWTVPETGLYSIFAVGASGGIVFENEAPSRGAMVRGVFNLTQGEVIAVLVGQMGTNACSEWTKLRNLRHCIRRVTRGATDSVRKNLNMEGGGGGGGGGATFIYKPHGMIPLLVAAGGGGLSKERDKSSPVNPDAAGINNTLQPSNGARVLDEGVQPHPSNSGPGGGWNGTAPSSEFGQSLLEGGAGGQSCNMDWGSVGGFGGGGGSCTGGGGGGGYKGGDAGDPENGQGGVSYISPMARWPLAEPGWNQGPGWANFFPAEPGCGCKHRCLPMDPNAQATLSGSKGERPLCLCQDGHRADVDGTTCQEIQPTSTPYNLPTHHLIVIILCILVAIAVIIFLCTLGLNKYRQKQSHDLGHEPLRSNPEVQLSRLRQAAAGGGGGAAAGAVTEYNPNYEFGGSTCTLQDLKEVPRENLTLVRALGQGAFGEVYQGYLANVPGETSEIAVAVKTLPEVSSGQAEQDFMLEALIMSKFSHDNIVRFLGVCFQKLPRFIVLELLPGGDLKSFLRETRPKPAKPSPLSMADLLHLAIDVAKGCQYLEENHFIHRDIAARNCLLTSKGPERVVKIADFGMARDIYKADYYRKGGKAMLPVKWMPPEAFLDGVFTSKTDVWSFGVLLWEVLSMGYMPYPGRGNQEVMQLVTSGGRLEPPTNCPGPVYHIMMQCWHPVPEERPPFATILERLGYCVQDPNVVSAPLPVFHRPPSMEKDATLMRPPDGSDGCLQVIQQHPDLQSPGSEDYLIPMPSSNYSLSTERTELQSSAESVDRLLRLDEELLEGATGGSDPCWDDSQSGPQQAETCFSSGGGCPRGSLEALPLAPASPRDPQPLDAAALNRLTNRPLPYVNVDVTGMTSLDESPAAHC